MVSIFECDRCGKQFIMRSTTSVLPIITESRNLFEVSIIGVNAPKKSLCEVCSSCRNEIEAFILKKTVNQSFSGNESKTSQSLNTSGEEGA